MRGCAWHSLPPAKTEKIQFSRPFPTHFRLVSHSGHGISVAEDARREALPGRQRDRDDLAWFMVGACFAGWQGVGGQEVYLWRAAQRRMAYGTLLTRDMDGTEL